MEKINLSRSPYELGLHITKFSQGKDLDEIRKSIISIKEEVEKSIQSRCIKAKKYYGIYQCCVCHDIEKCEQLPNQKKCLYYGEKKACNKCTYANTINCDVNVDISIAHGTYDIATLWRLPHEYWHSRVRSKIHQIENVNDILSIPCHRVKFSNFDKIFIPFQKEIINYVLLKKEALQSAHKELFKVLSKLSYLRETKSDLRMEVFLTYTPHHILIKAEFDKDKDARLFPKLLQASLSGIGDYEIATIISVNGNWNGKKSDFIQNWGNKVTGNYIKDEKFPYRLLIKAKNLNNIENIFTKILNLSDVQIP